MTPAEVLAMRNRLSKAVYTEFSGSHNSISGDNVELADWLIESGWVTKEPERKGE